MSLLAAKKQSPTFITGKNNQQKDVWIYANINRLKKPIYDKVLHQNNINPEQYGDVISSGLGNNPPPMIKTLIEGVTNGVIPQITIEIKD